MKNLAIIPARSGSKRIPDKNIKEFLGKPIIAYPIEASLNSGLFSEVMVSTDSNRIASIAKDYGAKVPFLRSKKNSDDFATLNDVFVEVVDEYRKRKQDFDHYCLILPTSPLLTPDLLKQGFNNLQESIYASVRPVIRFSYPIQRAYRLENGKVSFINPEHALTRSQDLEPAYHDAGMFYFVKNNGELSGPDKGAYEIDEMYAQDIDTEEDWRMAEMKYKLIFGI